jgi:molybdopterin-guanine dinucleotide biosynthesis protein A
MPRPPEKISALILAGGQAKRMRGADKGLVPLHDKPLIAWVLESIAPQVDEILISANRNIDAYGTFGHPVLQDGSPDFNGPLAGLLRGLETAKHPLVLCVPCDTPFLPVDLAVRLLAALEESQAQVAVAATHDHVHRTVCLCRRDLSHHLAAFLEKGGRKVGDWQGNLKSVEVLFAEWDKFQNFNTSQELATAAEGAKRQSSGLCDGIRQSQGNDGVAG